ncbi:MAG: hypothetical protein KC503_17865 [Myxococcales bacterium]|nr:hypothetical protein [Myxococcales bacterium]
MKAAPARVAAVTAACALLCAVSCARPAPRTYAHKPTVTAGAGGNNQPRRRLTVFSRARGKRVSRADLLAIYGGWFRRPYPYMFSGGTRLSIGGRSLGVFMGGVKGIILYGGLSGAIARHKGYSKRGFYNTDPIKQLAGLAVYKRHETRSLHDFSRFNPAIVRWGYQKLIPNPNDRILGVRAQEIYKRVFSRFFRLMSAAYRYLKRKRGGLAAEAKAYRTNLVGTRTDALTWLPQRYGGALPAFRTSAGSALTAPMAIGFWLRRTLDGTAGELHKGLTKLMTLFDRGWWTKHGAP